MGDSGSSTFIFFAIVIAIYIVGMSGYTLYQKLKEKKKWK